MLIRFNFICNVGFMNDQDSLDKNTLIGCYLWTPLCLLDNWDRVLLFVMNSKWLITWEGHSEWLVSQAGKKNVIYFYKFMFKVPSEYWPGPPLCSSSSIFAADHLFVNCSIIRIQSEMRPGTGFPGPRDQESGNRYWRWKLETSKNVNIYNWSHCYP